MKLLVVYLFELVFLMIGWLIGCSYPLSKSFVSPRNWGYTYVTCVDWVIIKGEVLGLSFDPSSVIRDLIQKSDGSRHFLVSLVQVVLVFNHSRQLNNFISTQNEG